MSMTVPRVTAANTPRGIEMASVITSEKPASFRLAGTRSKTSSKAGRPVRKDSPRSPCKLSPTKRTN